MRYIGRMVLFRKFVYMFLYCVIGISTADAGCVLSACDSFTGIMDGWVKASVSGNQCWGCSQRPFKHCGDGNVVPQLDDVGDVIALYQCNIWAFPGPKFNSYNPGVPCSDSPIQSVTAVANSKVTYKLSGQKSTSASLGDFKVFTGSASCIYNKCKSGYAPSADKKSCIISNNNCPYANRPGTFASSGQKLSNQKCNGILNQVHPIDTTHLINKDTQTCELTCTQTGWDVKVTAAACKNGYKPSTDGYSCVAHTSTKKQVTDNNEKKCESSGGRYVNGKCVCDVNKNLVVSDGKCVCLNETDFEYNGIECVLTNIAALKQKCESASASGAVWDNVNNKCNCNNTGYVFSGTTCIDSYAEAKEKCFVIVGAVFNNNECKCSDTDKVINEYGTECVYSDTYYAKAKIKKSIEFVDKYRGTLDTSVWKDRHGDFNTSRLASDSIAGVVVGTAGGLITSSVVKKKQVEKGFEDIKCTIGGQTVADFGDEFNVGIK